MGGPSTGSGASAATPVARTWPDVITALLQGRDLTAEDTRWALGDIMSGNATDVQIAGFAVALRAKGESVDEVGGLVRAMYDHAVRLEIPGPAVDIVGTGGDRARTVNISTMSAITVAGAGAKVVKHGNRAASSASGATDVLEHLGIDLTVPPRRVAEIAEEAGITYCPAPVFHSSLRHAGIARKELGVLTFFNFLGPLTNPARVEAQATGVADARIAPVVAGVLAARGTRALVFRGEDGLDELTVTGPSRVWLVADGKVEETLFDPREVGVEIAPVEALRGADPAFNADVARRVLAGEPGPVRDAVLLNSAAALTALDGPPPASALAEVLRANMTRAAASLDTGAAADALARWSAATQR
ncbi:anthranilate phosphoribosyltransferase [Mangrovactinospora gilvigrisea]|uniref:Anthranilate phosphoribosyltransferase n=1 Tax=Mangrovactinospora gilvigrisea TaxID=1428644 RepID=A0A1J7BG52_9ACTN|nr:anthranilate phosphoribosyltransferase [Mangrovactinospora gilvigrisea]OIV37557.1 anthranilate phosphoribosyltransferase [Mangrovactinospora gilvigrisea]